MGAIYLGENKLAGITVLTDRVPALSHNVPRYVTDTDQDSAGSTHLGKNITSYVADGSLWKRLNGTDGYKLFEDIYAGDYFQMSRSIACPGEDSQYSTASADKSWVTIAGIDTLWGSGEWPSGGARDNTTGCHISYHHLVMVPGRGEAGNQYFGRHRMNPTSTTGGGYTGSEMFKSVLGAPVSSGSTEAGATISQQLKAEFGSHLMTTRELLSNSVGTSLYNRFGNAGGASNGWAWASCQCVLMSEVEVYGTTVWSSSGFDTGNAAHQMPLFAHSTRARNNSSAYWWLKAVASASDFCDSRHRGYASYNGAGDVGVYVRPRFVIA